jgi:hypothetical protein
MPRVSRPDPARADLDRRVREWMREPWSVEEVPGALATDDERFDALARELFGFQYERCAPFARFCAGRGATPATIRSWREIPAVPTGAFKELALRSFPADRTCKVFRTSGTTDGRPGALHLDTLDVYEASLLPTFERFLLPELGPGGRMAFAILAPSHGEAGESSLSHMFGTVLAKRGAPGSAFFVRGGKLAEEPLLRALRKASESGEPLAACGTAFAFVHLCELLAARAERIALPPGSRVMETGGFKGRARERSRDALYAEIEERLGVPAARIVNQYGMTELGSQFYDTVLADPSGPRRKLGPPWVRVRLLDPATGGDVPPGEPGMITIVDLANTGSVLAVQTADLGRASGDGFEVQGRAPGAEARGCSIAADEMLGERA